MFLTPCLKLIDVLYYKRNITITTLLMIGLIFTVGRNESPPNRFVLT